MQVKAGPARTVAGWLVTLIITGFGLITAAELFAASFWIFDLLTHFRRQYLLGLLVLVLVSAALRRWVSTALVAGLIAIHLSAVIDLWRAPAVAAQGGRPLRVTTINVHHANNDRQAILAYVKAANPDILIVQEAWSEKWADTRRDLRALFAHQVPEGRLDESIPVLFSRYPIESFDALRPAGMPFRLLQAELVVDARRLLVLGLHPPYPVTEEFARLRNVHFAEVAEIVRTRSLPTVVTGDFNSTPWSPWFSDMMEAGGLRMSTPSLLAPSTWPAWFWPAGIPIDHVLTRGLVYPLKLERGPPIGSDHYPLTADLSLGGT